MRCVSLFLLLLTLSVCADINSRGTKSVNSPPLGGGGGAASFSSPRFDGNGEFLGHGDANRGDGDDESAVSTSSSSCLTGSTPMDLLAAAVRALAGPMWSFSKGKGKNGKELVYQ